MTHCVNNEFLTLNITGIVPCVIYFRDTQAHCLIKDDGFLILHRVMFDVYAFRKNHNPKKKRGLYGIPMIANQRRATSRHDDFLTSLNFAKHGSMGG